MFHTFDTEVAELFKDTNIATLFQNLCFWIIHNKTNEKNRKTIEINGKIVNRYFTFNSISAFTKQFPYFSKKQIENYLTKLREKGFIAKDSFNVKGFDRTSWYCLVDEEYWMKKYLGKENISDAPDVEEQHVDNEENEAVVNPENTNDVNTPEKGKCISPNGEMGVHKGDIHFLKTGNGYPKKEKSISSKREMDIPKTGNAFPQNGKPIPDINSDFKPNPKLKFKQNTAAAIRSVLLEIDNTMILDADFYPAAADFLNAHDLDDDYLRWFYQTLKDSKNITNIRGYFFKVFFREVYVERYKIIKNELDMVNKKQNSQLFEYDCPVCREHLKISSDTRCCTRCETPINPSAEERQKYATLYAMDDKTRELYIASRSKVLRSGGQVTENLKELNKHFGIVS